MAEVEVTVCQFTGCIRNDLDPVMVAGKQYCYGHSYLMDVIEGDGWEETEEWYNTYKELLEREVGEDD